jgi:hypothetical protein
MLLLESVYDEHMDDIQRKWSLGEGEEAGLGKVKGLWVIFFKQTT